MGGQNVRPKTQIFFARSYRHLEPDGKTRLFFLLGCVLPCLVLFLSLYTKITLLLTVWVKETLSSTTNESSLGIAYGDFFPFLDGVYYVQIPSTMPSFTEVTINLTVTNLLIVMCLFLPRNSKGGRPLSIYFIILLLTHLVAIIFFIFAKDFYPYSATQYSELYVKQQVGIWLSFLILLGLVMGILGYGSIKGRLIIFVGTMTYSFIFGCVRYLVFLFILSRGSSLYMPTLFFSLGPLFDFLYLVCFYSIYINMQIKRFNQGDGRLDWHWL